MGNSTLTVQSVVDFAATFPEIQAVVTAGGYSDQPALTIANDVMSTMLSPKLNFKWNRFNAPVFYTISWQQDYASLAITNLAWIEHAWMIDINSTAQPKPLFPLEAKRDIERTFQGYGRAGQICWLPNDQLMYGTWGANTSPNPNNTGQLNPGPNVVYTNPLGATVTPSNPCTQIKDSNGNLQVLTTFGTCGSSQPSWPAVNAAVGTTTNDGTSVWTVVNPKGQGFRIEPIPSQTGVVYQINVVGQARPIQFTTLSQSLEPVPDDFAPYFRQGFIAHCYRHSPDPRVRGKFEDEYKLWIAALVEATKKSDRERDQAGFYPAHGIMDDIFFGDIGPANPYGYI